MKKLMALVLAGMVCGGAGLVVGAAEVEVLPSISAAEVELEVPEFVEELTEDTGELPREMSDAEWLRQQAEEHARIAEELQRQANEHSKQARKLLSMAKAAEARATARTVAGKVDLQQQVSRLTADVQSLKKKVAKLDSIIRVQVLRER